MKIPFIPDAAPFNKDQRAWLSGFLAGLHSRAAMPSNVMGAIPAAEAAAQPAAELNLLVGTQTGTAENLAEEAAELAHANGFAPKVTYLDDLTMDALSSMELVIVVISTYGEGEMPDNAQLFWDAVSASTAPRLESMKFGVLALGDTSYEHFCQAGKLLDMRFEQLGARRLIPRVDCDIDFEDAANGWIEEALPLFKEFMSDAPAQPPRIEAKPPSSKSAWNRKNPYPSTVLENRRLSGPVSGKQIHHLAFSLADSGITYEAGDALGVMPVNDAELVSSILASLNIPEDKLVAKYDAPISDVLRANLEIATPSKELVAAIVQRSEDGELSRLVSNGDKEALDAFLWGKDVLDLLRLSERIVFNDAELLAMLKPLQHRAYSISSSPKSFADQVHLTVAAVRWTAHEREHKGVCSTYLTDTVHAGSEVPVFLSPNKAFRVPEDDGAAVIMVGPGTGVAPFRAFLQERRERGAAGKNWLFFGDQYRAHDFIYEDEIGNMSAEGVLTRLDLAFSRDQNEKIYVQSRMAENGKELFAWLQDGAYFYVCGDATRMARDVDTMLHRVIGEHGRLSEDQARDYVNTLKRQKRYLRDIY